MNTTENNKLLAKFLGWNIYVDDYPVLILKKDNDLKSICQLPFNSDWNDLMQVVEKIESLNFSILIGKNTCVIEQTYGGVSLNLGVSKKGSKIEAVHKACVKFVKWHNEQNK